MWSFGLASRKTYENEIRALYTGSEHLMLKRDTCRTEPEVAPSPKKVGPFDFGPQNSSLWWCSRIIFPGETTFCLRSKGIKEKRIAFLPLILPHKIPTKKKICTLGILNFFSSFFSLRRSLNVDYPRNKCNYELLT